jgi:hypothetical protein
MTTQLEAPVYVIANPAGLFLGGQMRKAGDEVGHAGWPKHGMTPLNESARRVSAYHARHGLEPFLPKGPLHHTHGFYLPAMLPRITNDVRRGAFNPHGSELPSPVPESERTPDMPAYVAQERVLPQQRGQDGPRTRIIKQVGSRKLEPGEAFAFLGWPGPDFAPANAVAAKVAAYFAENGRHPDLLPSPWCCYRQALFLPVLTPQTFATRAYPDGSYRPIDPTAPAVVAEIENCTGRTPGERGELPFYATER